MSSCKLSWKPKRDGATFCAPACGHGCLHADYVRAIVESKAAAKQLNAVKPGFRSHQWENGGWHWEVRNTKLGIRVSRSGWGRANEPPHLRYTCELIDPNTFGHGPTLEAAINNAIRLYSAERASLVRQLNLIDNNPWRKLP